MIVAEVSKSPEKRSRQQRRTRKTHQKLLMAGREVFAEKGLDLTTIDDITERADVGKGTFYYHFKTKEKLINELIRGMLDELTAAIEEKCRDYSELDDLLDKIIGTHIEFFSSRWEDFVLFFQGRADLTLQTGYDGIETPFLNYLESIESILDSAIKRHLPAPVLRRITCAVTGFISGYYSFAVISTEGEDVDETLRSLRGAFVASLSRFIREATPSATSGEEAPV